MSTIALVSTYAPSEGFGGPARIYHQRLTLEAAGHEVTHIVIESAPTSTASRRPSDLYLLSERPFRAQIDHIYNDVDLGRRAAADRRLVNRVRRHLEQARVDIVFLEQPFLVDVIDAAAISEGVPMVYSCHNIEYSLRRELERFEPRFDRPRSRSEQVREIEQRAVDLCSAATAICGADAAVMKAEFGRLATVVPNGSVVADMQLPPRRQSADGRLRFSFAGSSYWPNQEGFSKIATPSLAFLPPNARIEVTGTVGNGLLELSTVRRWYSMNASRVELKGFRPMATLVQSMRDAIAVLVPVFTGGGSNLKSADALASGSPVIMTRRATTGYEDVLALDPEGVTVVNDASEFRAAMRTSLSKPRPESTVGEQRRSMLSWSSRLAPLRDVVLSIDAARPGVATARDSRHDLDTER